MVKKLVYKFVLNHNYAFDNVTTSMIMKFAESKGFSRKDAGFALQQLKKVGAVWHSKRDGWIAKG